MLLGPIFRAELLRTSRRRRYYALRLLYGSMLLVLVWLGYEKRFGGMATASIAEVAAFAGATFVTFAVVQLIAILLLIPALFGGSIADEKQRKTLHYLMASQLSSFEIVVDKVLGRAPHLAVFLALGLPVVSLLGLFGGVPPDYVVVAYVGTTSTAAMAVAMTVLVSTMARKVRQAVLIAYVLMLGWQFAPPLIRVVVSPLFPRAYAWIEPVNTWVDATCPMSLYVSTMMRRGFGPGAMAWLPGQFAWMVGLQLGSAAMMILVAVWQLRPTFRRQEATRPRRKWFGEGKEGRPRARRRWWDRPDCGEDAMSWKERHFARTDVFTKLVVLPATILVSTILVLYIGLDEGIPRAFSDMWGRGLRGWGGGGSLVDPIRVASAWYVGIWLLAVAGTSASSVTMEREEDTWISLTSTPLTGREILRGKVAGALWAHRGFAAIPLMLWTIGLATGEVHPIGFLGALVALGVVTWMVAAVGIHASMRSPTTSKALVATIAILALLYGYPLSILRSFLGTFLGEYLSDSFTPFVGLPARVVVGPLVSYRDFDEAWRVGLTYAYDPARSFGVGLLAFFATVAGVLTQRSVGQFDRWLDRPRMTGGDAARAAEEAGPVLVQS